MADKWESTLFVVLFGVCLFLQNRCSSILFADVYVFHLANMDHEDPRLLLAILSPEVSEVVQAIYNGASMRLHLKHAPSE